MSSAAITAALYEAAGEGEDRRLEQHPLERMMTLDTIERHLALPAHDDQRASDSEGQLRYADLKVADVGGATGTYAFHLADKGCAVHLRDLSPGLLAVAQRKQEGRLARRATMPGACTLESRRGDVGVLESIKKGNAIDAESLFSGRESGTFDIVLLLGPLYHLLYESERVTAIQNALALLKPITGILFLAFVSRNAHLRDIAVKDPSRLIRERVFYDEYRKTGRYVRRGERNVESYQPTLGEIEPLVGKAGGCVLEVVGTEGILGGGSIGASLVRTTACVRRGLLSCERQGG